jgi:hypothetical protein
MVKIQNIGNSKWNKDLELSFITGGTSTVEDNLAVSYKVKHILSV